MVAKKVVAPATAAAPAAAAPAAKKAVAKKAPAKKAAAKKAPAKKAVAKKAPAKKAAGKKAPAKKAAAKKPAAPIPSPPSRAFCSLHPTQMDRDANKEPRPDADEFAALEMTSHQEGRLRKHPRHAFIDWFKSHPARDFLCPEGDFVAELLAHPLYCLASRISVQRWGRMFRCHPLQSSHTQQWHVCSIDVGRRQRSSLLTRAAFCELLVLRMIPIPNRFKKMPHLASCVVSRRHFLVSRDLEALCQEGQRFYKQQLFENAARSWGQAALLQHAHSYALLSTMIIDDILGTPAFKEKRLLEEFSELRAALGLMPSKRQKRAFLLAEAGAALGCAHSKGVLARCYVSGYGTGERTQKGHELALESASAGSCMGQFVLGQWFAWISRDERDRSVALVWYRLAAEQGHASAQLTLGTLLWTGSPEVFSDKTEAVAWWKRASDQGLDLATASLKSNSRFIRTLLQNH